MTRKSTSVTTWTITIVLLCTLLLYGYLHRVFLWEHSVDTYRFFIDRERVSAFIDSFGSIGPVALILIQFLQVLFAPLPGEATGGFIGGYLFGAVEGFLYSSIGLTCGSILAFLAGRFLGKRFIRRLIPTHQLARLDSLVKHQGLFIFFLFFIMPGFPKDYLCLFLGMTAIPTRVFILIATVGRIPGTFIWSLQGEIAYGQHYGLLSLILLPFIGATLVAYRYRENLYRWIEKTNGE